ncbi:MAG: hypothetical protein NT007_03320 [Candidatus Kapabacteria bacterium]|nr:hypothetical protein [Candidatus Kapabacteria bacterium]
MSNNFPEWLKTHPGQSFDDYKTSECSHTDQIHENKISKKSSKKVNKKIWISSLLAFIVFYIVGQFAGDYIMKFFRHEKTSNEILGQKWIKESYGDFGLKVETPIKLMKGDLNLPENLKQMIEKMDCYQYTTVKGFVILINSIKYRQIVNHIDLKAAALGSANEARMQKGVTNFTYNEEPTTKYDIPGIIQKGTCRINDIDTEFINAIYGSGLNLWEVMVMYQSDDEVGKIASKRVIESIEIKSNQGAI